MKIYPAIDLINGACVRLSQGLFETKKVYNEDPLSVLDEFKCAGAECVHVVDLDGAKDPTKRQFKLIEKMARSSPLRMQTGGGVRSIGDVRGLLSAGAERVVVGTLAVENPGLVLQMFDLFGGDQLTLAIDLFLDAKGSTQIAARGWQEKSGQNPRPLIDLFARYGLKRILCTDIAKDGMMTGPNIALYRRLAKWYPNIEIQASGGVGGLKDLLALKKAGLRSAVVGKAIYEKGLDLAEAILRC